MIYTGTGMAEFINVHDGNRNYTIELAKMPNEPTFVVMCDYDDDWGYEFYMENNSDYERIKYSVMDALWECDSMDELLDVLSEVFEDGFADILVEDECDCETGCKHCGCK